MRDKVIMVAGIQESNLRACALAPAAFLPQKVSP